MENKHAPFAVVVILSLAAYSLILHFECKEYRKAMAQMDAGLEEFMQKSVKGKKLYEFLNPHTVGTFTIKDKSYACGVLNTPLPVLPQTK